MTINRYAVSYPLRSYARRGYKAHQSVYQLFPRARLMAPGESKSGLHAIITVREGQLNDATPERAATPTVDILEVR